MENAGDDKSSTTGVPGYTRAQEQALDGIHVRRRSGNDCERARGTGNGRNEIEYVCHYDSPLGGITILSDGAALTGLWFDGQRFFPEEQPAVHDEKPPAVFDAARRWLDVYFSGRDPGFTPPLNMDSNRGTTPFRKAVWEILLTIPFGKTMTYGEIARIIAERNGMRRMSAQAVGGAVGHNPVSLIVPCHRVVGAGGSLTGYGGGLDRKRYLLDLEMNGGR